MATDAMTLELIHGPTIAMDSLHKDTAPKPLTRRPRSSNRHAQFFVETEHMDLGDASSVTFSGKSRSTPTTTSSGSDICDDGTVASAEVVKESERAARKVGQGGVCGRSSDQDGFSSRMSTIMLPC